MMLGLFVFGKKRMKIVQSLWEKTEVSFLLQKAPNIRIFQQSSEKNPRFRTQRDSGRVFPSKPGIFPSQTNVQSLWVPRGLLKKLFGVWGKDPYLEWE